MARLCACITSHTSKLTVSTRVSKIARGIHPRAASGDLRGAARCICEGRLPIAFRLQYKRQPQMGVIQWPPDEEAELQQEEVDGPSL